MTVLDRTAVQELLDAVETTPEPAERDRCERWPEKWRLRSSDGLFVRGRCGCPGKCSYCARAAAVETAEMLALDALEYMPELYAVLTTVDPKMGPKDLWKPLEQTVRAVRRRFPAFQYACLPEYTTGRAPRSGGHRRLHLNLVIKGVPPERREELGRLLRERWFARTGAHELYVGELRSVGGVIRYLALHFQKPGQAPPTGWAGHRVRFSRGYLVRPASVMREEARESLREKRRVWRARRLFPDAPAQLIEAVVEAMREQDHARRWHLVEVREFNADGEPLRWERLRLRPHGRWRLDDGAPPDDDWLDACSERDAWWSGLVPADLAPPFAEMPDGDMIDASERS